MSSFQGPQYGLEQVVLSSMHDSMNFTLSPITPWLGDITGLGAALCPESLAQYQLAELQKLLAYVKKRSDFYATTLASLHPESIGAWADIQRLPFTSADDLKQHGQAMLCVSQRHIARVISLATSGTSGVPKRLYYTAEDLESCVDFFAQGMQGLVQTGDRVAIFFPIAGPGGVVDLLGQGLERIGCSLVHWADATFQRPPPAECFVGLPSHLYTLAKLYPFLRPATVLLCADSVPDSIRKTLEVLWQTEVFAHYGSTESGLGGGVECRAHAGYHMRDADLLWEIVDPKTGFTLPPGELGELVLTTLRHKAMPLIRYRTGDYGCMLTEPCPCGSLLYRLGKGPGRLADQIVFQGNQCISLYELDEILYAFPDLLDYDVFVDRARQRIRLTVSLVDQRRELEFRESARQKIALALPVDIEIVPHTPKKIGLKRKVHYIHD